MKLKKLPRVIPFKISVGMLLLALSSAPALAAPSSFTLSGSISGANGYAVLLVQRDGTTRSVNLNRSGAFAFRNLKLSQLTGASLQLVDSDGRYGGPVVLATKGSSASISFSGKAQRSSDFNLGRITLRSGYATLKRNQLKSLVYTKPRIPAPGGKPAGAGELGLVANSQLCSNSTGITVCGNVAPLAANDNPGSDPDNDGIPSAFDADDDGDLILDASDPDSAGTDTPYTGLNFDFRRTLNAHVRSGLSDEVIDGVIGGENVFALTFFISIPSNSPINGGYIECDDALTYCRRNTPLGFYGGLMESSDEFRNKPWSDLLTPQGYPRMEQLNLTGGTAIVASIQPRVGRAVFRPGDTYRLNLTSGSRVVSTRSLALAPYFVSVPAMKEYNAGFGAVAVDYGSLTENSGSIPGLFGNPIVLSGAGTLTLTFWRPQRQALRSDESGFYDWGNLNYGVIIDQAQATCAGYYSGLPSDLVEDPNALAPGGSPFANQGAKLSPLRDQQLDRLADSANTFTFTVDLKACATRAGLGSGEYSVSLRAAGEPVTGGESAAVQAFRVQIP